MKQKVVTIGEMRAAGGLGDPAEAINLARLAAAVGASERAFSRLLRQETGFSWREWHDRMRFVMTIAGCRSGSSSTELAIWLGYSAPSAFVAAFRRRSGMVPKEWPTVRDPASTALEMVQRHLQIGSSVVLTFWKTPAANVHLKRRQDELGQWQGRIPCIAQGPICAAR